MGAGDTRARREVDDAGGARAHAHEGEFEEKTQIDCKPTNGRIFYSPDTNKSEWSTIK